MNKKTYETPEMIKRMISTVGIAADIPQSTENETTESDDFWQNP